MIESVTDGTNTAEHPNSIKFSGATVSHDGGTATVEIAGGSVSLEALAALGVPVVKGPYTLDYTDILANNAVANLFTPSVGDVIINWWIDPNTWVEFDGDVVMGQGTGWTVTSPGGTNSGPLGQAAHGSDHPAPDGTMMAQSGSYQNKVDASGNQTYSTLWRVSTAGPVQVKNKAGGSLGTGHADYYFLVKLAT